MSGRGHGRGQNRSGRTPAFKQARPAPHARHIGRCPATGKRRYPLKTDAKAAKKAAGLKVCVYRCEHCGMWELGSLGDLPRSFHREFHAAKTTNATHDRSTRDVPYDDVRTPDYGTPPGEHHETPELPRITDA